MDLVLVLVSLTRVKQRQIQMQRQRQRQRAKVENPQQLVRGNTVDGELAQEAGLSAINLFVIYHTLLFKEKKKRQRASQTGRKSH